MNEMKKRGIERAAMANGNLMNARMAKLNTKVRMGLGMEMVHSWERLPGSDDEVFVQTVMIRDAWGKPFIGRAYLRPHELDCYNFEAGFLIASGKAYRALADDLTTRGLLKVRTLFAPYEAARKRHVDLIDLGMMALEQVSHESPSTHDARLKDALENHRVYVCDECSKPYAPENHLIRTHKGTLYVCPHCGKVVPKVTLKALEEAAEVPPKDEIIKVVTERLEGRRGWVEHKDGTITEELTAPAKPEKGEDARPEDGLESICPDCRRSCKKDKWACPDYLPPMQEGSLCADCSHNMECSNSGKMVTACPDFGAVAKLTGTCKECGKEFKRPNADPLFDGYCPEHRPEPVRDLADMAVGVVAAEVAARVIEAPPGTAVGGYAAIASAFLPEGLAHMPEGIEPSEGLTLELGMVKTKCVQCKKDLERDPDDGSDLCPKCKEGGWTNMEDGEWHRFRYWKDPKGVQWDMFQSLCEKYLKHPEEPLVKDGNMAYTEEVVCPTCFEKNMGAK